MNTLIISHFFDHAYVVMTFVTNFYDDIKHIKLLVLVKYYYTDSHVYDANQNSYYLYVAVNFLPSCQLL